MPCSLSHFSLGSETFLLNVGGVGEDAVLRRGGRGTLSNTLHVLYIATVSQFLEDSFLVVENHDYVSV